MTEKQGPPTHDLGHDASSKSRVMLGIAYRGEEAFPGLEAVHIGLSKSRFRERVWFGVGYATPDMYLMWVWEAKRRFAV